MHSLPFIDVDILSQTIPMSIIDSKLSQKQREACEFLNNNYKLGSISKVNLDRSAPFKIKSARCFLVLSLKYWAIS